MKTTAQIMFNKDNNIKTTLESSQGLNVCRYLLNWTITSAEKWRSRCHYSNDLLNEIEQDHRELHILKIYVRNKYHIDDGNILSANSYLEIVIWWSSLLQVCTTNSGRAVMKSPLLSPIVSEMKAQIDARPQPLKR